MLKTLKALVIVILALILVVITSVVISRIQQSQDQKRMEKSDNELIGRHFYVPRDGKTSVDVNLYLIDDGKRHPVVFNIHGGAFIAGDADTLDTQSDRISREWNVHVVSINYTLATKGTSIEYGSEEVADTIRYFREHTEAYHIEPEQLYVMGYSAGAYHAMNAVLMLKQQDIDVAGQILCYGFLRDVLDIYHALSPEKQESIAPALFVIAENDPIGDGSLAYEEALRENGVAAEILTYSGALHGFIEENNPEYDALHSKASKSPEQEAMAREAERQIGRWIGEQMETRP